MKTSAQEHIVSRGRISRAMVSPVTSIVFFAVFVVLFILAAVFPQAGEHLRIDQPEGIMGRWPSIVVSLGFFDLFHSWYFGLTVSLFAFHLIVCSLHKLTILRRRPAFRKFTRDDLLQRPHSFSVSCPASLAELDIEKKLRDLGFRRLKYYSEDAYTKRIVCERGLPFRWLSWCYHMCILLVIIGLAISSRFSLKENITIPVGTKEAIELGLKIPDWITPWAFSGRLMKRFPKRIEIEVADLAMEYEQDPSMRLPDRLSGRFLAAWGRGSEKLLLQMTEDSLRPRNWRSTIRIRENGRPVLESQIGVNKPLRYGGFILYEEGYQHRLDLDIGGQIIGNIRTGRPFSIPQMEGEFRFKTPRTGALSTYNGRTERLTPSVLLQYRPPQGQNRREWRTIKEMIIDRPTEVMHSQMAVGNLREAVIVGYRYDPGSKLLLCSGIMIAVLMALRIYVPWYQIFCHADRSADRTVVTTSLRMVGLFTQSERLDRALRSTFLE